MKKDSFYFDLPKELIAQVPLTERSDSRLMVVERKSETISHANFKDISEYLKPGDVLVRNNTRVLPARLFGVKTETNAHVEVLLLKQVENYWECLVGNARVVKEGTVINFATAELSATCVGVKEEGIRLFEFHYQGVFYEILERLGEMPLPPYIKTSLTDKERYQTVYASELGSAAAPTAGLHFNETLLKELNDKDVEIVDLTLHVGLGTFKPLKCDDITEHKMHHEYYSLSSDAASTLQKAREEGRRIIAVGTTSLRALETVYQKYHAFKEDEGLTDIYLYPGIEVKAIDALITNFHLPDSTLILLVSAFAGTELIRKAYQEAIKEKYRFFSFGDAMLIL